MVIQEMENFQGDLTDILRPSSSSSSICWEFVQPPPITTTAATSSSSSAPLIEEAGVDFFGDPFCNISDPFLNELDMSTSCYFEDSASGNTTSAIKAHEGSCNNTNMFSKIQISRPGPNNKSPLPLPPTPTKSPLMAAMGSPSPSGLVPSDRVINVNSSRGCLIDNSSSGPVQISSPRNLGIKRRKSQSKKVVCIPAPAALNSRPSGEVVPSDLWAWRKYGQKPIKGSPYPRGYYRCSSSKGCPARKQVERSRTDPNMLVITYTSEHNHPWPTQRNALAGSTRTQPTKSINVGSKGERSNDEAALSVGAQVKEEEVEEDGKPMDQENEMVDGGSSYTPAMPDNDFFADLGEIDGDPLELLFSSSSSSQGFVNGEKQVNKGGGLDPFGLFDWSSMDTQNPAPFGEANRGL